MVAAEGPAHDRWEVKNSLHVHVFHWAFHCLAPSQQVFQTSGTKINKNRGETGKKKTHSTHPFLHMQVCTSFTFTGNNQSLEVTHTSFAGAWHAHLGDGGENRVVHVALANQVNYPVCDLFDGAPVQLVVLSRLQMTRKECNVCQERMLHWRRLVFIDRSHLRCRRGFHCWLRMRGHRLWTQNAPRRNSSLRTNASAACTPPQQWSPGHIKGNQH